MKDLIIDYSTQLNDIVIILAAAIGVFYFKKFKNSDSRIFIYYLVYVAFVDFIGSYPTYFVEYDIFNVLKEKLSTTPFKRNYWWFTTFWNVGSALFMSYYYQKIIKSKISIKIIRYLGFVFFISSCIYILYDLDAFFNSQLKFINIFGAIVILNCIALYFVEVLNSDKILVFYKSLNSIISAVLLIWWLIITPLLFYEVYFSTADSGYLLLRKYVYLFSNIFMYSTFIFAIIYCKPEHK